MLDTDTKRRIDTARDILVGKVPDPKSQVEQITIALIYKFMDDIDVESEEFGGKRSFFAGEYARYGWAKLMRSGLGGHETLNLYAEAITTMPENPGIPPLFCDIFKNAYLPYRDPETLRAFLKTIDEFTYDHSERLGDAFEYLLSVLGSQGDAGQFRTPRHIIDFIVGILEPEKGETVLDPACGTAGFLISSYKHILAANTDPQGASTLTPDDKGRLAANFKGYDISPDMVRLSLVNMYLHGFTDPHIFEYDTLTSEERWNEYADVILANPPFMSPKGGIRPHNRFSVKSKRSEVLFVDYMAEHLMPSGRAGIIVPEGIIFQSQNAYKQLRKMLVEEYLVVVVSLPAGVFQPYSGVKTSILILDKSLAKKTDCVAFFKVENDGFDLGAQRRPIDKDDLPQAQDEIGEYLQRLRAEVSLDDFQPALGLIVEKGKLAANGEYNLSGERYRENGVRSSRFPIVPLGEVADVIAGQSPPGKSYNNAGIGTPFYQGKVEFGQMFIGDPIKWTTDARRFAEEDDVLMSVRAPVGPVNLATQLICIGRGLAAIRPTKNRLLASYTFYILRGIEAEIIGNTGTAFASINKGDIKKLEIPLPPLEVQKEIVAEIEGYQKVIDGARAVVNNYRPHIPIDPAWPMVELRAACKSIMDGTHLSPTNTGRGKRLYLTSKNVRENHIDLSNVNYVSEVDHRPIYAQCPVKKGDVLYVKDGANTGLAAINTLEQEFSLLSSVAVLRGKCDILDNRFLCFFLNTADGRRTMLSLMSGVAIRRLTLTKINRARITLPPLETQQAIVAEIEAEQALVEANRELIERFEKKIQDTLARVWGDAEPDTAEA